MTESLLTCMALDKTGSDLLVTDGRGTAKVLDVSDLTMFKDELTIDDYGGCVLSCAINNDGDLGYISGYKGHTDRSEDAILLNDEKQLMTVARDGTLRIFDAETGENIYGFFNHRPQEYRCLASHPSGRTFLAANDNSMVYILKNKP